MKLHKLEVEGFRGAPRPFVLPLKQDKCHFIFAENGRGKSTIPDALELLTTGDLAGFRREDCGLDAAISLHGDGKARVVAELRDPRAKVSRTLEGSTPSAVEIEVEAEGDQVDLLALPTLRQATIYEFMQQTSGEKRQALLELLDLDALNGFRNSLRTGLGNARDRARAAKEALGEEKATLEHLLAGDDLLVAASASAKIAGVADAVASEEELEGLELKLPPGEPNRQQRVTVFARALEGQSGDDATAEWNDAVADDDARRAEALSTLLERGAEVLEDWPHESCPLCEAGQDRAGLTAKIDERSRQLAESKRRIATARGAVGTHRGQLRQLAEAIKQLLEVAPAGGWPSEEGLKAAQTQLEDAAKDMQEALAETRAIGVTADVAFEAGTLVAELQGAAKPKESPELAALQRLNELRGLHKRVGQRQQRVDQAEREEKALSRLLDISDETIKAAVEEALAGIEGLVARYFEILMADQLYSNIKLVYTARRSGQVEFSIDFGDHTVKPPQRIMSESQLNALGLALLLARVKESDTPWRTIVLDDVVNSFDLPHRAGLVRLLKQEFGDWQVVILSHDPVFRDIARREAGDWEFHEIVTWTPTGGPVLGSGNPLNRLKEELDAGRSASGLGGHARRALESRLGKVAMELECRIPYDPASRYTAHDYLQAVVRELKEKDSPLAGEDVLKRMDTASYMSTRVVHDRTDVPEATTDELRLIAADLEELEAIFRCEGCGKAVWYAKSDDGHQCQCGTLSV